MMCDELKYKLEALSEIERDQLLKTLNLLLNKKKEHTPAVPRKLVGYVTTNTTVAAPEILSELRRTLPDYMVPSSLHIVDKIPVLPNGKIDKKALIKSKTGVLQRVEAISSKKNNPINSIERQLTTIWEDLLNIRPIHPTDNFFEIGGDSILTIQIIAKARKLGIEITPGQIFDHQTIRELAAVIISMDKSARSGLEEAMTTIWEEVLNIRPIHLDDNFFEIGGDSILSIQIIAKARKVGIEIEPRELFDYQSIRQLVSFIGSKTDSLTPLETTVLGEVPLTPIQHWFFETHHNAPHYWNQGLKITDLTAIGKEELCLIINALVRKHDALRSSFIKEAHLWKAFVLPFESIDALEYVEQLPADKGVGERYMSNFLNDVQGKFDLSTGNLFKCLYFKDNTHSKATCILIAHHLVTDAVSWQIILEDFKSAYDQVVNGSKIELSPKTTSAKEWATYLKEWATSDYLEGQLDYWNGQTMGQTGLDVDYDYQFPLLERDIENIEHLFDADMTSNLLAANATYHTKTDELLVTALIDCLEAESKGGPLQIGLERHGREIGHNSFDLSSTVGWFTSYFPVKIELNKQDIGKKIKSVKEQLRQIPEGGMGYGVLKYLATSPTHQIDKWADPPVLFNFLGTHSQTGQAGSEFVVNPLKGELRDPMSERYYLFEINSVISNGQLHIDWSYSTAVHRATRVKKLIADLKTSLLKIIAHCGNRENEEYTPSDFPDARLSQDDLDNLLSTLE